MEVADDLAALASMIRERRAKGKSLAEIQVRCRKLLGRSVSRDEIRAVLEP